LFAAETALSFSTADAVNAIADAEETIVAASTMLVSFLSLLINEIRPFQLFDFHLIIPKYSTKIYVLF
jgi:hypothetical protein